MHYHNIIINFFPLHNSLKNSMQLNDFAHEYIKLKYTYWRKEKCQICKKAAL